MERNKKSFKKDKYQERLLNEVNSILRTQVSDPRLQFASATKVELNQDFSVAKVFWDSFDVSKKDDISKGLNAVKGKVRSLLASSLGVRHTPEIVFVYDSQFESEQEISNLLNSEKDNGKFNPDQE